MSYILEALNKSQREHARGSVPTLQGQAPSSFRSSERRVGLLLGSLLIGASMALSITAYLSTRQSTDTIDLPAPVPEPGSTRSESPNSGSYSSKFERPTVPAAKAHPGAQPDSRPARPTNPPAGQKGMAERPAAPPPVAVPQPPAKAWSELPADIRAAIGNLVLNIHVYSERPEKRFVFINEHEYGEGDVLQEGPTLEAIGPMGLILAFRGERFRLDM